ncbi:MAG: hypothetical protein Q8L24_00070 [bacterium]|nr:hypothetical protein [bacterium]
MEIRPVKKSEWEKLKEFNAVEYRADHILTNPVYYDWQFDAPWNKNKDLYETLGVFGARDSLVGTFGLFSAPYNYRGTSVMGSQLCNLIVKKELRALGYGYLLLEKASALNPLTIDHTINDTAWTMFAKAGWQKENLSRWLYIIKPETDLYSLSAPKKTTVMKDGWHFDKVSEFGPEMDEFWNNVKHRYPITVERSSQYLNWRFAKNPLVQYLTFVARSGKGVVGLVIVRSENVKNEKGPMGVKVARIVDFIAEESAEGFVLSRTTEYARENSFDFIDYFSSGDFHKKGLVAGGFEKGDKSAFSGLPILFNPVSFKRARLNFAVYSKERTKLADWYTTKGGGDQDRSY